MIWLVDSVRANNDCCSRLLRCHPTDRFLGFSGNTSKPKCVCALDEAGASWLASSISRHLKSLDISLADLCCCAHIRAHKTAGRSCRRYPPRDRLAASCSRLNFSLPSFQDQTTNKDTCTTQQQTTDKTTKKTFGIIQPLLNRKHRPLNSCRAMNARTNGRTHLLLCDLLRDKHEVAEQGLVAVHRLTELG